MQVRRGFSGSQVSRCKDRRDIILAQTSGKTTRCLDGLRGPPAHKVQNVLGLRLQLPQMDSQSCIRKRGEEDAWDVGWSSGGEQPEPLVIWGDGWPLLLGSLTPLVAAPTVQLSHFQRPQEAFLGQALHLNVLPGGRPAGAGGGV